MIREILENVIKEGRNDCLDSLKKFLKDAKVKDDEVYIDVSTERIFIPTKLSISQWKKIYTDDLIDKCNLINIGYTSIGAFRETEDIKDEVASRMKNPKGVFEIEFNEIPDNIKSYFRQ